MQEVEAICDRVIIINNGKIVTDKFYATNVPGYFGVVINKEKFRFVSDSLY